MWIERYLWRYLHGTQFSIIDKQLGRASFRALDVGAGSHASTRMKEYFPDCEYHGIDRTRTYGNTEKDIQQMSVFYEMDLTERKFASIPDGYFDVVIFSHVLEHLPNALDVLGDLLSKVKSGGLVYIEYPRFKSISFPHMYGTLNFFDDPTHVYLHDRREIFNVLLRHGCVPCKWGLCRNFLRIALLPLTLLKRLKSPNRLRSFDFADLFGFAEYAAAIKNERH